MGIKVIANTVLEDSVQVAVSNSSTTSYSATDALNVTGGARHIKASTDVAERAIIYRNNDKRLKADCCVLAGASRSFGHALGIKHFSDCDGTYGGGTGQTLQPWDANDFGRNYARDLNGTNQYLEIDDMAQVGLDFSADFWFAGWVYFDATSYAGLVLWTSSYYLRTGSSSVVEFRVYGSGGPTDVGAHNYGAVSTGAWLFVYGYHEDGVEIGVTVNNATMNVVAHTGGVVPGSGDFRMGYAPGGLYLNGRMGLWCCGTDLGRGPAEMASWLYNGGSGRAWGDWTEAIKARFGLVSHWTADENNGAADMVDDYGANDLIAYNTPTVAAGPLTEKGAIANRYGSGVTNPNEADAAQFNKTEIVGPRVRGEEPQDLVYFFPSRSASFVAANSEYLARANAGITGLNNGDESFSFGGWYRQDGATGIGGIVTMGSGATTNRRYGLYNQSGTLYFEMFASTGASVYPGVGVSNGTWYFVTGTYDVSTRAVSLYINGALVSSSTLPAATNTSTGDFRLGSYFTANYGWCTLKNFFFMDTIISADDMSYLYNSGSGKDWHELKERDGMQEKIGSWYPLNEASGGRGDVAKWGNHLSDNNSVTYDDSPLGATAGGGLIAGAEGFGVFLGAGSGSAYDEELTAAYFGESLDLGVATWPVSERPMASSVSIGEKNYKVERSAVLTFENLNREQLKKFEEIDLDAPVFLYDSEAAFLHDKLWHCLITDYRITPEFDDLSALTISINRLQHYPVAS